MTDLELAALKERIAEQKLIYRALLTDIENPRLLDSQIESATGIARELPARLDADIAAARLHLDTLLANRDTRILIANEKLRALQNRKANLKEQYIAADEALQALNQQLKRGSHAGALAKLKALREQSAAIQATLPEHLRDITSEADLLLIQEMIEEQA